MSRNSSSTLVLKLGLKVKKPFASLSITVRPAPAVRNVGPVIFWKCFHNVNNLWDAPGKKGLELGKLGQSPSRMVGKWENWVSLWWAQGCKHYPISPSIGLWVFTRLILVMPRFICFCQYHIKNTTASAIVNCKLFASLNLNFL